jgi:hypothetical protein
VSIPFFPIVYPALRLLLVNRLQKAVNLQGNQLHQRNLTDTANPTTQLCGSLPELHKVPLKRVNQENQIGYVSAIAIQLAQQTNSSAVDLAHTITENLMQSIQAANPSAEQPPLDRVWKNFTVRTLSSGWIYLELTHQGVAEWLQALMERPVTVSTVGSDGHILASTNDSAHFIRNSTSLFKVLCSHARCCSLLRSGVRDGMIDLSEPDSGSTSVHWQIAKPHPIPWLDADFQLRCQRVTELRLIGQLVTTLDQLSCLTEADYLPRSLKLAQALAQAFQAFYADCRIWGTVKTADRALAQTRLGLVLATQAVLKGLLQDVLGVHAPIEL